MKQRSNRSWHCLTGPEVTITFETQRRVPEDIRLHERDIGTARVFIEDGGGPASFVIDLTRGIEIFSLKGRGLPNVECRVYICGWLTSQQRHIMSERLYSIVRVKRDREGMVTSIAGRGGWKPEPLEVEEQRGSSLASYAKPCIICGKDTVTLAVDGEHVHPTCIRWGAP